MGATELRLRQELTTGPTDLPHPWRWLGIVVIATCVIVTPVLLYEARPDGFSIYDTFPGVFTGALASVGVILTVVRGRTVRSVGAGAGVVLAALLAGVGMFAVKHWVASQGFGNPHDNLAYLELGAATIAVVMTIAWTACLIELVHGRSFPVPTKRFAIFVGVVAGAAVVLLGDLLLSPYYEGWTTRGAFALTATLPCGLALAGTGWARRAPAFAVCATVAVTAILQVATEPIVSIRRPVGPVVAIVVACAVVASTRFSRDPIEIPSGR